MTDKSPCWSRGQLEHVIQCPACGSSNRIPAVYERCDNEGAMPDRWCMAQCNDCKSIWLDPRPDAESLPRAYDDYYTHSVESDEIPLAGTTGLIWRLIHGYLNHRFGMQRKPAIELGYLLFSCVEPLRLKLDYYGRHLTRSRVGQPGRLLDIGCGNGAFLSRAAEMGWHVHGLEIDPKAVASCRSIGIDVLEGDAFHPSLKPHYFDVITMSHVIEHVVDQPALLQQVYDLLAPGGWFWIALPNPESIGLRVSRSTWHALHPPYHLCIPSQKIVASWFKKKGFTDLQFLRRGAHARGVWRISQKIAQQEGISLCHPIFISISRLITDALATISPRWAEETIILARKPRGLSREN